MEQNYQSESKKNLNTMLKSKVILLLFIAIFGISFYLLFQQEDPVKEATSYFYQNDPQKALACLEKNKTDIFPSQMWLYRSYISLSEGNFKLSKDQLTKASQAISKQKCSPLEKVSLLEEIKLSKSLNYWLLEDYDNFSHEIIGIQGSDNSYVSYLEGLSHFIYRRYDQALNAWEDFAIPESNSWLSHTFNIYLTPELFAYQRLQCMIKIGKEKQAMNYLNSIHFSQHQRLFLLGLIYGQQLTKASLDHAFSCYQKARESFSKISQLSNLEKEELRELYLAATLNLLKKIINENSTGRIENKFLDKLTLQLVQLNSPFELEQITNELLSLIEQDSKEHLKNLLTHLSKTNPFRNQILNRLEVELQTTITSGNLDKGTILWSYASLLAEDLQKLIYNISCYCQEKIVVLIQEDNSLLSRSMPYLIFWNELCQKQKHSPTVAQQLTYLSGTYWMSHDQCEKALHLMLIAEKFGGPNCLKDITHELEIAVNYARYFDKLDTLCYLHMAIKHFNISSIELTKPGELPNLLADASFLLEKKRYSELSDKLKWILCLEPNNILAMKLLAKSHYYQDQYAEAIAVLERLPKEDLSISEMHAICLINSGKTSQGLEILIELSQNKKLSKEGYYYLSKHLDTQKPYHL